MSVAINLRVAQRLGKEADRIRDGLVVGNEEALRARAIRIANGEELPTASECFNVTDPDEWAHVQECNTRLYEKHRKEVARLRQDLVDIHGWQLELAFAFGREMAELKRAEEILDAIAKARSNKPREEE